MPSRRALKTKVFSTGLFVITGFCELAQGRLEAIYVAEERNGRLIPAGKVPFGLARKRLLDIIDRLRDGPAQRDIVPVRPEPTGGGQIFRPHRPGLHPWRRRGPNDRRSRDDAAIKNQSLAAVQSDSEVGQMEGALPARRRMRRLSFGPGKLYGGLGPTLLAGIAAFYLRLSSSAIDNSLHNAIGTGVVSFQTTVIGFSPAHDANSTGPQ
jgi:hypothetical protein